MARTCTAACLAIGLLFAPPGTRAQTQRSPSRAQDDAYPVWPTDGCSYWENQGVLLFFRPGSAVPLSQERADALLDHIAAGWREDRGFVLIEGHLGLLETPSQLSAGHPPVDLQRAQAVQDGLVARGVPAALIWVKPVGTAELLVPDATADEDDRQNRRAVVFNTRRGDTCLAQRRQLRITWFRTHCLPVPQAASDIAAGCARALNDVEQGN